MAASAEYLAFVKEQMAGFGEVSVRRMFSGAGFFRDGLMFALVAGDRLFFKCDGEIRGAFEALGLGPFTYPTKKGENTLLSYRRAPEACLDDPDEMERWCRLAYQATVRSTKKRGAASSNRL